nr:FAD-dependent oxidoreductase [Streptomyces mexicanus]
MSTLEDSVALRGDLLPGRHLVVVGAGYLGAEAAAVARGLGCEVTLVCDKEAPLADVLGPDVSRMLAEVHTAHGVRLVTSSRVRGVPVHQGRATGVLLEDGTRIDLTPCSSPSARPRRRRARRHRPRSRRRRPLRPLLPGRTPHLCRR